VLPGARTESSWGFRVEARGPTRRSSAKSSCQAEQRQRYPECTRPANLGSLASRKRPGGRAILHAIDRFQDATLAKPGYAIPFRFLGEAQEKKGLKKQAIKSYQRYLDLYPHAEDGDKIRKKIEKLYKEVAKEKEKR
jgi:tetratricopeptide (TPR) repeat protein